MKIIIESPDMKVSASLKNFIIDKVSKLEKLHDRIVSAEITLEHEAKKTKDLIRCTLILSLPGKDEYVKVQSEIFEDAILKVVEAAKRRLRIRKTQRIDKRKSGVV